MLDPFCLSCGSALDKHNFCATCNAFADDGMSPPSPTLPTCLAMY